MTVAELFVQLGIKGADSTGKTLKGVKSGLTEVKEMSIEAKAAIIGAVYALERMMSSSAQTGTDLKNFTAETDISAQSLQKWQWAAQQANNSAGEVAGSVKTLQENMLKILQGGQAPAGWAMFEQYMSSIGEQLTGDKMRNMEYMMQAIQKFAQAGPADVMKDKVTSLIGSAKIFAAMRQNAFRPDVMDKAPAYSDKQIGRLNKVDVAWANLGTKIKMAFGQLTAKDGQRIVQEISDIATQVIRLTSALEKLAQNLKVFQILGKVFEGWGSMIEGAAEATENIAKDKQGVGVGAAKSAWRGFEYANESAAGAGLFIHDMLASAIKQNKFLNGENDKNMDKPFPGETEIWSKNKFLNGQNEKQMQVSIQQNLTFQGDDGKDASRMSDTHRKAAVKAYQQIPALKGGE